VIEAIALIKSRYLLTGDAPVTFKPIVEAIRERGGDDFLLVEANQPELEAELKRAIGGHIASCPI
jgi:hypothetical protein